MSVLNQKISVAGLSEAGLSEETVLEYLRLVTLMEGLALGGGSGSEDQEPDEIGICIKNEQGVEVEFNLVTANLRVEDLPFAFQVWWLGRTRKRQQLQAQAERLKTYCIECGCLQSNGHVPDCRSSFYPINVTDDRQEPGIPRKKR